MVYPSCCGIILADRTNGGAYATMLRPSVSVTSLCIVAKRCVPEQNLLLTANNEVVYNKSIGTKMNDLDLCLEVVLRSCQPLHHIRH